MSEQHERDDAITESPTIDSDRGSVAPSRSEPVADIGGYRIVGKLGGGGMGIVYEAEQQNPRRRVALKVVRGGHFVDESSLRMFRREAETLARLAHPNIAAIYEADRTEDGQHYFTMELVSGRKLSAFVHERLGSERPTPSQLRERLGLFATICRAVNYAHQRGVIHRDLKPSNLLVTETGDVKILDFGLARITDADVPGSSVITEIGVIQGTLAYMSPEQTFGKSGDIDLRTDVYSLGVVLYELLTGRKPYETAGVPAITAIQRICDEPPHPMKASSGGVAIDPELQTITRKALEKEPDRRYQSAGALGEDVERFLANEPILAHPPSARYQIRKYVARHRGRVAALGAIAILLVALGATMVVQAGRVRHERDRAQAEAAKASAINRFLLDTLGGADPWGLGALNVTLLDALQQARAKAHSAFSGEPLVEASVLQTLGTTLSGLAEFAPADTALRTALDLRVAAGRRSPEVASSLAALSALNLRWARYDEAEKYAREALDIARERYGSTSLETAAITNDLATALGMAGKREEAQSLAQQAMQVARQSRDADRGVELGSKDPAEVESVALSVLTQVALDAGDYKTMEKYASERLAITRSRTSGRSAELGAALNGLGTAKLMNGDLEGAQQTYQEAIETARAALGNDHPEVATYLENLGNAYYRAGKVELTAKNLETVLAMRRRALGDDSEPVARTLANMAVIYRASGDYEAAERTYREAIDRLTKKLGPDNADVGITLAGLGDVLRRKKKYAEAESNLQHGLTVLEKANGEAHPWSQRAREMIVQLYTEWGKPAQADEYRARLVAKK